MHRSAAISLKHNLFSYQKQTQLAERATKSCDVFLNHRGIDTKRTIVSLLYDHLSLLNLRPFLDNRTMRPGDKLFDKIDGAIRGCKVGVAVFSPNYCDSYFCLHELALIMESNKKVIPIFCDIKPSQLCVVDNGQCPPEKLQSFRLALEEARNTVGLTYSSSKGNMADVVTTAADIVINSLIEIENEKRSMQRPKTPFRL
ncbi:TMV resistance protein N-like [Pyrus ussuriensis x Pyrus communis]|uniref:TMV resistance protein N-like n=1 Tax=Pyrus ussuriensis x Pyrus communis TaxID=2448454 RepID=A0A5N5GJZ6_9ROSA|nr:TIR-only protein-like [Pyrus x bretschneideri]KAB2615849.1 TMV resistance protein N-like [Pyrus ussuriensis x Pyrus communis]